MTNDLDASKDGGTFPITVDMMLSQPTRVTNFVQELRPPGPNLMDHVWRYSSDPEYRAECDRKNAKYRAEQDRLEAIRRADLSVWQRWREDNPYFFRKLFPWTIKRWSPPIYDEDDWDDD
jgi:hypothetical protein